MRAPYPVIHSTRGYLTVTQAAARLGIGRTSVHIRIKRGKLAAYAYPGSPSPTGWIVYVRTKDIQEMLRSSHPEGQITINQASKEFGISRRALVYYRNLGKLRTYPVNFAGTSHPHFLMLDRNEVESLTRDLRRRKAQQPPPVLQQLLQDRAGRITIADVLRERPPGVQDADIARAFGVSKQRVHQIKQKIFPPHG